MADELESPEKKLPPSIEKTLHEEMGLATPTHPREPDKVSESPKSSKKEMPEADVGVGKPGELQPGAKAAERVIGKPETQKQVKKKEVGTPAVEMFGREVLPQMGAKSEVEQGTIEITGKGLKYREVPVETYRKRVVEPQKGKLKGAALEIATAPKGTKFSLVGEPVSKGQAISAVAAASKKQKNLSEFLKETEGQDLVVQSTEEGLKLMTRGQALEYRLKQAGPEEREAIEAELIRERYRPAEHPELYGSRVLGELAHTVTGYGEKRPAQIKKGGKWQPVTIFGKRYNVKRGIGPIRGKGKQLSQEEATEEIVVEELTKTPSQIKEQYYGGLDVHGKLVETLGGSAAAAVTWPVTLPETITEIAASRITGKRVDILPTREFLAKQRASYGKGGTGQGIIGASIGEAVRHVKPVFGGKKGKISPLTEAIEHPVEATAATAGEVFGLWLGGKFAGAGIKAAGRGVKRLSDIQVESSLVRKMARRQTMREMGIRTYRPRLTEGAGLGKRITHGVKTRIKSLRAKPYASLSKEGQAMARRLEKFHRKALRPMLREEVRGLERVPYLYPVPSKAKTVQIPVEDTTSLSNRIWGKIKTAGRLTGKKTPFRTSLIRRMTIHEAMKPMIREQARPLTTIGIGEVGAGKRTFRVRSIKGRPREAAVAKYTENIPYEPYKLYGGMKKVWSGIKKSKIPFRRPSASLTDWRWAVRHTYEATGRPPMTHSTTSIFNRFRPGEIVTPKGGVGAGAGGAGGQAGYLLKYLGRTSPKAIGGIARATARGTLRLPALSTRGVSSLTGAGLAGVATLPSQQPRGIRTYEAGKIPAMETPSVEVGVIVPGQRVEMRQAAGELVTSPRELPSAGLATVQEPRKRISVLAPSAISGQGVLSRVGRMRKKRERIESRRAIQPQVEQREVSPWIGGMFDFDRLKIPLAVPTTMGTTMGISPVQRRYRQFQKQFRVQRRGRRPIQPRMISTEMIAGISELKGRQRIPTVMERDTKLLPGEIEERKRLPSHKGLERLVPGLVQEPELAGISIERMVQEQQIKQRQAVVEEGKIKPAPSGLSVGKGGIGGIGLILPRQRKRRRKGGVPSILESMELYREREFDIPSLLGFGGGKKKK